MIPIPTSPYARRALLATALLAALAGAAPRAQMSTPGEPALRPEAFATSAFFSLCVRLTARPRELQRELTSYGARRLPPERARSFLAGWMGSAWSLPSRSGEVVLTRAVDGRCSVLLRRADAALTRQLFEPLFDYFAEDAESITRDESGRDYPVGRLHTISHAVYPADSDAVFLIDLSTSNDANAPWQAAMTMRIDRDKRRGRPRDDLRSLEGDWIGQILLEVGLDPSDPRRLSCRALSPRESRQLARASIVDGTATARLDFQGATSTFIQPLSKGANLRSSRELSIAVAGGNGPRSVPVQVTASVHLDELNARSAGEFEVELVASGDRCIGRWYLVRRTADATAGASRPMPATTQ